MELTKVKWEDTSHDPDDVNSDYDGWGWQLNIGKVNIGWLPAYKGGKFEIAVSTITMNEYDGNKHYTLEEAMEIVESALKG